MNKIKEYWESLNFDYIKTYAGLRGKEFEQLKAKNEKEILALRDRILDEDKAEVKREMSRLRAEIDLTKARLINKEGLQHVTTKEISKIASTNKILDKLYRIVTAEIQEEVFTRCSPVYRDSIVFYSRDNQIIGILHFCFDCIKVLNEKEEKFEIDYDSYDDLKIHLNMLGHKIE